jgi:HSP20 family protein
MANVPERWLPTFRGLDQMRRDFDDLFDRLLGRRGLSIEAAHPAIPAIESYVDKDALVVRADLPDIDPKNVDISVVGNNLVIRGQRESTKEEKGRDYYHREISYGSFERSIPLPEGVKAEQIKASYKNGVLELTAPLPRESAARKVPITIESEPASPTKKK